MEVTDRGRCEGFQCREGDAAELRVLEINKGHLPTAGRLVQEEGN